MNMSAGEALRAAVQQRLMGVLEEVLGLIQTTVDQYESRLKQCSTTEEESEKLRGARALLLLRTEMTDKPQEEEKEQNENSIEMIIKVEEPDPWSISETQPTDPASGSLPPATSQPRPHEQGHGNPTGNHKTESEDSDEECPICRQLELRQKEEFTETAVSSETVVTDARCNNEDIQASNQKDKQEFESTQVKSEEEDQACSDRARKSLVQERQEEGERSQEGLSRTATNQDQERTSEGRKTSAERKDETTESEKAVSSSLDNGFKAVTDKSTLDAMEQEVPKENAQKSSQLLNSAKEGRALNEESEKSTSIDPKSNDSSAGASKSLETFSDRGRKKEEERARKDLKRAATAMDEEKASKFRKTSSETQEETVDSQKAVSPSFEKDLGDAMEQENANEKKTSLDAGNSRSFSNSAEGELSRSERNEKNANTGPKRPVNKLLDAENANTQDRARARTQELIKNLPTIRLVPLKFLDKALQNEAQLTKASSEKPALSPQKVLKENSQKPELCKTPGSDKSQQKVVQNSENSTSTNMSEKSTSVSTSVAAKKTESVKSPSTSSSPKKVLHREAKKSSRDLSLRMQKSRKAKTKARTELQNYAKEASESASDVNSPGDKVDSSSVSGKSKEDDVSKMKNSKTKSLTPVKSDPVVEEQGTKSLKSSSNEKTNGPLVNTDKVAENTQSSSDKKALKTSETKGDQALESSKSTKRVRPKSDGEHECHLCGTTFALKGNLLKHLIVHQEERPFSCSQCDATFKRKLNLKAHMSMHSEEKEFECHICHKKYTRKSNLGEHMKGHTVQKPFGCTLCNHRFTCSSNLRRHMLSHSNIRPFQCEVCGKNFGRKSILREHMVAHSREQPFSCEICKTKFARKSNLQKHMRLHDGTRRFKCRECGMAFTQKVHLNQHMFQHTGEKPFRCPVCHRGFTRKAYVQQHRAMFCPGPAQNPGFAPKQMPSADQAQAHAHAKTLSSAHKQDKGAETQEGQNGSKTV